MTVMQMPSWYEPSGAFLLPAFVLFLVTLPDTWTARPSATPLPLTLALMLDSGLLRP